MKLYSYFRSGASHRLRIALRLKGLQPEYVPVDLLAGQHLGADFKSINTQGFVPVLEHEGTILTQSPAIIEWLEERYPTPALLPGNPDDRAKVRAMAAIIGCDIHPLNNRRILQYLRHQLECDEATINTWCQTWIGDGFDTLDQLLKNDTKRQDFCFGATPTLADVYLIPQIASARRFKVDLTRWPAICAVDAACAQLEAFRLAAPALQPDAL